MMTKMKIGVICCCFFLASLIAVPGFSNLMTSSSVASIAQPTELVGWWHRGWYGGYHPNYRGYYQNYYHNYYYQPYWSGYYYHPYYWNHGYYWYRY